jgi:hypothetical protein
VSNVAFDQTSSPHLLVDAQHPSLVQQVGDGRPWGSVEQQVVPLRDDQVDVGLDADRTGDRGFEMSVESGDHHGHRA